jgi:hypothetical protein
MARKPWPVPNGNQNLWILVYNDGLHRTIEKEKVWRAYNMSGLVAHKLSGLKSPLEVTYETDRNATGDTEDEIQRGL